VSNPRPRRCLRGSGVLIPWSRSANKKGHHEGDIFHLLARPEGLFRTSMCSTPSGPFDHRLIDRDARTFKSLPAISRTPPDRCDHRFGRSQTLRPRATKQNGPAEKTADPLCFVAWPEGYAPSPSMDGARLRQLALSAIAPCNCVEPPTATSPTRFGCSDPVVAVDKQKGHPRSGGPFVCWRGRRDSNPRPPGSKPGTLSN
jgi:hypothetical protein